MSRMTRLKTMLGLRRPAPEKKLDARQAHVLRQNLRALLTSKEHLARTTAREAASGRA
jgi:hypothetical protein